MEIHESFGDTVQELKEVSRTVGLQFGETVAVARLGAMAELEEAVTLLATAVRDHFTVTEQAKAAGERQAGELEQLQDRCRQILMALEEVNKLVHAHVQRLDSLERRREILEGKMADLEVLKDRLDRLEAGK